MAENAAEPFDREITICDQLASYLSKWAVAEEAAAEEEARDLSGALQGFKPLEVLRGGRGGGRGCAGPGWDALFCDALSWAADGVAAARGLSVPGAEFQFGAVPSHARSLSCSAAPPCHPQKKAIDEDDAWLLGGGKKGAKGKAGKGGKKGEFSV